MMLFRDLVVASKRVSATTRTKEKASLLAECLKRGQGQEIALAASYLSGQIPQGSLGIGWAILHFYPKKARGKLPLSLSSKRPGELRPWIFATGCFLREVLNLL
jgi:hypothetical protein